MKLLYSYTGRLCVYLISIRKNFLKIFFSCHYPELVTGGRYFLTIICFMLFAFGFARSQSRSDVGTANNISVLNIGDPIPDALWNTPLQVVNHPQGQQTITLADYKGKLIILDFWATWCSSCIKELPRLDSLQVDFNENLKLITISSEPKLKIESAISKFKIKAPNLPFIHSDSILNEVFPHRFVPHEVWINKGKIVAITSASKVSATNIRQLMNTGTIAMETKRDLMEFDDKKSLSGNIEKLELVPLYHYESLLSERIDGAGRHGGTKEEDGKYQMSFINYPLNQLYRTALGVPLSENDKISWQLNSDSTLSLDPEKTTFCYEIKSLSTMDIPRLKNIMLNDLNRHFRLRVIKEQKGNQEHYVICNAVSN